MNIKSILTVIACLSVFSFALPEIRVTTKGNQNPDGNSGGGMWGGTTTYKYFAVDKVELTDASNSRNNLTSNTTSGSVVDSIKVRGNSTANAAKKPYRIKFATKRGLFGKEEARSWVLLANFYDGTFALNAMAFEMGKRMGLEFTNSSQMVDLYINGTYKGIYQLTEQIQSHKGRVDLKEKHNGWLVEFDYHDPDSDERNQYFKTSKYNMGTLIKWPQLDDTSFTKNKNDTKQLDFVKNDVNGLMNKMAENGFPTNGYRDLIDMESWAKYVLIQLVLDNFDFNNKAQDGNPPGSNYSYKIEGCDKIKGGPLWDFDLAAGVTAPAGGMFGGGGAGSFPAHYKQTDFPLIPKHPFYARLWEDPVFKAKYKKLWIKHKSDFTAMSTIIDQIKEQVLPSIRSKSPHTWANNTMGGSGNLTEQTFNTEVNNLKSWWTQRLNWVGQQLGSNANGADGQLNIDASKDITQNPPATCATGSSSSRASSSSVASSSSAPSSLSSSSRSSSSSNTNITVSSSSGGSN
ncbi:MAG: CotH kinase family protein, partial [Fibromonadales bacterium]|nr:CotH kinase family protein [Fibromonadales bacterium]